MKRNQEQQDQLEDGQQGQDAANMLARDKKQETEEVVPGVPVTRSSTPRPLPFDTMASYSGYFQSLRPGAPSTFPERAPSAPPLPEELEEHEDENELDTDEVIQDFQTIPSTQIPPSVLPTTNPGTGSSEILPPHEQNTGPLPAVKEGPSPSIEFTQKSPALPQTNRALVIFSVYLTALLLIILTLAALHSLGFGHNVLANNFAPLEVPWLVIMYGLLGGCVSSLIRLGHLRTPHPPLFVVITWFARPYIGAVLAIFAYILLTSGLFIVGQSVERHMAFFWLVGALAGFCEGWVFGFPGRGSVICDKIQRNYLSYPNTR